MVAFSTATDCAKELHEDFVGAVLFSGTRATLIDACVFWQRKRAKRRTFIFFCFVFLMETVIEILVTRFVLGSF